MLPGPGEELDLGRWVVGDEFVNEYLGAVDDTSPIYGELGVAPSMALAARALGALLEALSLPAGTIHAAQELRSRRAVRLGEEVSCVATLSRAIRRGDWCFVSAEFTLYGSGGDAVLAGNSSILLPVVEVKGE